MTHTSPKGEVTMKKMCGKLSLPLAVLTTLGILAFTFSFVDTASPADTAADGQKLSIAPTGSGGSTHAPVPVLVGGMFTDTTSRVFRTTTEGWLSTSEANKDRDLWLGSPANPTTAFGDSITEFGVGDSTATPIYTAPYGRLFLHIKLAPGAASNAGTCTWVRLAISVRAGYGAALDSTFVPLLKITDSLGVKKYGTTVAPTTATAGGTEFYVDVPVQNSTVASFGGMVEIPSGALPSWCPYTFVKIRAIAASAASSVTAAANFWWLSARLIGRPF